MGLISAISRLTLIAPWRLHGGQLRFSGLLFAFAAGALSVLAFAPFGLYPFALIGPLLLLWLLPAATPGQGFRLGWAYGLGLLGFGVFWLHISIDQFGNLGTLAAMAITLLFVFALGLLYGLMGWAVTQCLQLNLSHGKLLWIFPSIWVLGEWFRGWFLSGFPWLVLGYSQIDSPLNGFAPLLGVYGVSWMLILSVVLLYRLLLPGTAKRLWVAGGLLLIWGGGLLLHLVSWTEPAGNPFRVSLIQGNITQQVKWQRDMLRPTLELYTRLTQGEWQSRLIVWPETAVPAFAHQVEDSVLQPLSSEAVAHQSELLVGIPVWDADTGAYYNSLMTLGGQRAHYAKRHLVPFGEFMPLKKWLRPLIQWLQIPMADFTPGGAERPLLTVAGYPAGVSICYEDAFGDEVAQALPEAAFLVNVSNDAWFGDSLAPPQHLEIARMRALETGRYMLRSTNTGISALIDPKGKIADFSPAFQAHVLSGEVTPMQGATPYVRVGNWPVILVSVLLLIFTLRTKIRRNM